MTIVSDPLLTIVWPSVVESAEEDLQPDSRRPRTSAIAKPCWVGGRGAGIPPVIILPENLDPASWQRGGGEK